MFKKEILTVALLAASAPVAVADEVVVQWTNEGSATPSYTFHLDLQPTAIAGTFTLNGYRVHNNSGTREATMGAVTLSPDEDVFAVSLFFNSSTGETFSIGADLDPGTLSGDGNLIRTAHGSVGSDQAGVLAVVP